MKKIINDQSLNHKMLTCSVIDAGTMFDAAILVPPQIITWNNLQ